jgi:hypothetical protein
VQQQIADIQVIAVLGQILDGVTTVPQYSLAAVDIGDRGRTGSGRLVAGVVGKYTRLGIKLPDINNPRTLGTLEDRKLVGFLVQIVVQREIMLTRFFFSTRISHGTPLPGK